MRDHHSYKTIFDETIRLVRPLLMRDYASCKNTFIICWSDFADGNIYAKLFLSTSTWCE